MTFLFLTEISRDGDDGLPTTVIPVQVLAYMEDYAKAIDCPPEYASRFTGQKYVEIRKVRDMNRRPVEITDQEYDLLKEEAVKQSYSHG
jgi:hypothetical protein